MKKKIALFLLVFCMVGGIALADPARKLGRGLVNLGFGWFEIVNEMGHEADRRGPLIGVPSGLFRGVFLGAGRMLAGVYEVVTFLLPNGQKEYEPIILPESVFARR